MTRTSLSDRPARPDRVAPPQPDSLRAAYQSISECHREVAEFRAKLLALLPLATGTGAFVLLNRDARPGYIAIGAIGALFTIGLFVFERRNVVMCQNIAHTAMRLERQMHLTAARFECRPDPILRRRRDAGRHRCPADVGLFRFCDPEWVELAGWIVYGTVLVAWLAVSGYGFTAV